MGSYLHSGFIRNVQEFIDADPAYDRDLYGNLISTYGVDGRLIGYPLGLSLSGFFYNADIFEAAGIDPYSLTSMERVYDAAVKICEGGYAPYAIAEERHLGQLCVPPGGLLHRGQRQRRQRPAHQVPLQ